MEMKSLDSNVNGQDQLYDSSMVTLLIALIACREPDLHPNHGWSEVTSPRSDLQCWVRWSQKETTICAPKLLEASS